MFIGHIAVGFASKRVAPRSSLGVLMAAPILLDGFWPVFLLLGWEQVRIVPGITAFNALDFTHYPWSHSLLMSVVWGVAFGLIYFALTRYGTGALVITLGIVSHWVLDWITHRPDLPLTPWSTGRYGLGLWNSIAGTVVVEGAMYLAAVWLYARVTHARDAVGRWACTAFVGLFAALYASDAITHAPPPSVRALALTALIGWLVPFWAWWFDAHRAVELRAAVFDHP